jgi:uncharacterized protein
MESISLLTTDDVRLDATLHVPAARPIGGFVMAHPHPLFGGDMEHPLVLAVCEEMESAGWLALRFNFRGTNGSGGTHGKGVDEILDVQAAIAELSKNVPSGPMVLAGYSFGAAVILSTPHAEISARIGIATPVSLLKSHPEARPTLLIHPRHDQYTSIDQLEQAVSGWEATSRGPSIEIIEGADHFLNGFVAKISRRVRMWTEQLIA